MTQRETLDYAKQKLEQAEDALLSASQALDEAEISGANLRMAETETAITKAIERIDILLEVCDEERHCAECGDAFNAREGVGDMRQFCSAICFMQNVAERQLMPEVCSVCG